MPHATRLLSAPDGETPPTNDEELVAGLLRGGPRAVETLVDRYGAGIHRVASRLLSDGRDAEEVTQDVLMTVMQKIGTFKHEAKFSSWVYGIAGLARSCVCHRHGAQFGSLIDFHHRLLGLKTREERGTCSVMNAGI